MGILTNYQDILKQYSITEDMKFKQSNGGFNKSWILSSENSKFFLKSKPEKSYKKTLTDCKISEFMLLNGILTAKPKKTINGKYIVENGEYIFSLFEYIKGDNYKDDNKHLHTAASTLAEIHNKCYGYKDITLFEKSSIEWTKEQMNKYSKKEDIKWCEQYVLEAEKEIIKNKNKLPETLIHWDFHGGNMKFYDDKCIPFDFEFMHNDYRILDIANSLICLTSLNLKKIDYSNAETFIQKCELNINKAKKFISSYSNNVKLNDTEINCLPSSFQISWNGWTMYTLNNMECSAETKENAKYFPKWVEENKHKIIESLKV